MNSRSILKLESKIKAPLERRKGLIDTQKHKLVIADQLLQTYRMNLLSQVAILHFVQNTSVFLVWKRGLPWGVLH